MNKILRDKINYPERAKINDFALSVFIGVLLNVKGLCLLLIELGLYFRNDWLFYSGIIIFVIVSLGYFYYMDEFVINGSYFRKK